MHPELPVTLPELLEALEGIAYVVSPTGQIVHCNSAGWNQFAEANGAPELTEPRNLVGRTLFSFFSGEAVRAGQRELLAAVVSRQAPRVVYGFRCDSADVRREVRMSISPIVVGGTVRAVLYHSVTLAETPRPPMQLLRRAGHDQPADAPIVSLCSYCKSVRSTGPGGEERWISAEEYYQAGGKDRVRLSHGVCPACYEAILAPVLARLRQESESAGSPAGSAAGPER